MLRAENEKKMKEANLGALRPAGAGAGAASPRCVTRAARLAAWVAHSAQVRRSHGGRGGGCALASQGPPCQAVCMWGAAPSSGPVLRG